MPRPCKRRRICTLPGCGSFGPLGGAPPSEVVGMSVDEYETIRLIDFEGLTQEQCAARMDIARTTVQAIYTAARAKLAECLVCGAELRISGGQYKLCDGNAKGCGCGFCRRENRGSGTIINQITEEKSMRIAVTFENDMVGQHFGKTQCFKIFDVADGQVVSATLVAPREGHGALVGFLKEQGVSIVICGGIGDGMCTALDNAGIMVYAGVTGAVDDCFRAKLANTLQRSESATCGCHGKHDHDHSHEGGCGCGGHQEHSHDHEHRHNGSCGCGNH